MSTPYSHSAEIAVIGSVLFDNACWQACEHLQERDFYHPLHQTVWAAVRRLMARNMAVDCGTVFEELAGSPVLTDHKHTIEGLLDYCLTPFECRTQAKVVSDTCRRRDMIRVADEMRAAALGDGEGYVEPSAVMASIDGQLDDLRSAMIGNGDAHDFSETGLEALDGLGKMAARRIRTGFDAIDSQLGGGLSPGQNTILAAATSVGKSALSICIALNAVRSGTTVGYFALEMPRHEIAMRGGCFLSYDKAASRNLRYNDVSAGCDDEQSAIRLRRVFEEETHRRLFLDDRGGLKVSQLSEQYRTWEGVCRRRGIDRPRLIIVDNLGNLTPEHRGDRTDETGRISKALLAFAKRHDVALLTLHHVNRESVKDERPPKIHDLRQSGEIEQDANAVMFLHRESHFARQAMDAAQTPDEYEKASDRWMRTKNGADVIFAKNRNGPLGKVHLACDIACNTFWTPNSNVTPIWERAV
jgi:replicative DNA helicase